MPETKLTAEEQQFLRACPQRLFLLNRARPTAAETRKLRMVQQLTHQRLIRGRVDVAASNREATVTDISLTTDGRRAIGLPIYTDAANVTE